LPIKVLRIPYDQYLKSLIRRDTNVLIYFSQKAIKRTANIICKPDHAIWKLRKFEDIKPFLKQSFPQLDWDYFTSDEDLKAFAETSCGVFPSPQYCDSASAVLSTNGSQV